MFTQKKKKRCNLLIINAFFMYLVTPVRQFSNQLLASFKRIYELKAILPVKILEKTATSKVRKVA